MITVERDPRTREILIRGPDGFTTALEDNVIVHQQLLRLQRLLNEVYEAGRLRPNLPTVPLAILEAEAAAVGIATGEKAKRSK